MNVGGNPPIVTTNSCKRAEVLLLHQVAQPLLVKKLQADKVKHVLLTLHISSEVAGPDCS